MRTADTNIVLRLITGDNLDQERIAKDYITRHSLLVTLTVTMECEWVLRSYYRFTSLEIEAAMLEVMALDALEFQSSSGVRWALAQMVAGADFADMIHLVASGVERSEAFVTFDRKIARQVRGNDIAIETLR